MRWSVLNPYGSTAFLLGGRGGERCDILLDMESRDRELADSLRAAGSSPERIGHLLITHFHADHLYLREAAALVRGGTRLYMGARSWEEMREYYGHRHAQQALGCCQEIAGSGQLLLLPPTGEMTLAGLPLAWATFPHGDGDTTCSNLAFRVGDHAFSGDTSITSLLAAGDTDADRLLGLQHGDRVRVLAINIAQLARAQIRAEGELPDRRRRNYLHNHGIFEDLLRALADPRLGSFFAGLEALVPHHLRRPGYPLRETAAEIARRLQAAQKRLGYSFRVVFSRADQEP